MQKTLGPSSSLCFPGYLDHIKVVPSVLKLICVLGNWWCLVKLTCVLGNWFVFWKTDLCFGISICLLGNHSVLWETDLSFRKLLCVLVNWFVCEPFDHHTFGPLKTEKGAKLTKKLVFIFRENKNNYFFCYRCYVTSVTKLLLALIYEVHPFWKKLLSVSSSLCCLLL